MIQYLRYMNAKRLWNEFRCRFSYLLSLFGIERYRHMPTFLSLEPANWCMLRCPQCPVGMRGNTADADRQTMSVDLARCVIDQAAPFAHTIIFHFQGEPLLNKQLPEMIAYAHSRRLFTMLSTNAQTLTPELAKALLDAGLDRIIISVDGLTQETYAHYRVGGNLQKALSGMRAMADLKQGTLMGLPWDFHAPEIILQCLYLKSNEHQWKLLREQYRSLGADRLEMKTAQFYDFENGHPDMPSRTRYARYKKGADGLFHLKHPLRNRCYRLWSGCVVTTDGTVLPCCFDKDHAYPLGKLMDQSLDTIMHSEAASNFRRAVLRERKHIGICRNCIG